MSCPVSQNHYFWWLWSWCSPLPIPNREVKPSIADDTALVCGKVGRRQSFIRAFQFGMLFFLRKFRDFIMGEVRYNSLMKTFFTGLDSIQRCYSLHYSYFQGAHGHTTVPLTGYPQEAEELFVATERNAKLRYEGYKKLSEM